MKNILLLINQLHTGGAPKVVSRLSIELNEHYNVILVTYNRTDKMFQHKGEHIFIDLPFSGNPSENNGIARFIRFIVLIIQLRKIKKTKKIHTSISFLEASNIVNVLSKRKEKVILSVRSHLSSEFKDDKRLHIFKTLIRALYNRAFQIVVPSGLIKTDLVKNFFVKTDKISLIYNFIDKNQIDKLKNQHTWSHFENNIFQHRTLINVGRIASAKAQNVLVPVLKKVKEAIPDIKLIILGEGPLKDKLITSAKEQGLRLYDSLTAESATADHDIFLLGFKENPFPYLSKSSLMVSTSIYEGFPNAMIEAMACGVPVISSDCPSGPREILAPDTDINITAANVEFGAYGVLLPVLNDQNGKFSEDVSSWATTIVSMLQDNERRTYYADRSIVRSEGFSKKTIIEKWINLIES